MAWAARVASEVGIRKFKPYIGVNVPDHVFSSSHDDHSIKFE